MALGFARPWALLLLPVLAALLIALAWRRGLRHPIGLPLRLIMVTLLVIGIAEPTRAQPRAEPERLVILVDRSASVSPEAVAAARAAIAAAQPRAPDTLVVQFAERPLSVTDPAGEWPALEGAEHATDLAAALDFARQLLSGHRGTVVLASDGVATTGDTLSAAERLAAEGIQVDVWPLLAAPVQRDVAVEAVHMPGALWAGEPYSVTVSVYARQAITATLSVRRDGEDLAQLPLDLQPGSNHVALSVLADAEGLTAFEAQVSAPGDERPQNDFGGAIGLVRAPPAVLIIASDLGSGQRLQSALGQNGLPSQVVAPAAVPTSVGALLPFQVAVLADVSASALSLEQLAALEAFVYAEGRGLIVGGGPESYSLGGYQGSALEQMLPVQLEPPERAERPPANLLLILDRSGSMSGPKVALAKEAAMRAVEILQPNDRVGVVAFSDLVEWRVPLTVLGQGANMRSVLDSISTITASGGTDMLTPLESGIAELLRLPPGPKHIVLLSDGVSARGEPPDFRLLVEAGLQADITVSTIAIGDNADEGLMASIAEWGEGRFHVATTPESLPRLVLAETRAVRSEAVQRGTIRAQIAAPHPLVNAFSAQDLPPLEAYVALTARPFTEADLVLTSPLEDPLLAAWQFGLGRVVAWTSDIAGDWTPAWETWPDLGRFWTQVVRYALPNPAQGPLFAQAVASGRDVHLQVLAAGDDGRGINLADGQLTFAGPDGALARVDLRQTAPGEYAATFDAPQPGAYRGLVTLTKDASRWQTPVGFVVGYPPEFDPRLPPGDATLNQVMAVTGGQPVSGLPGAAQEAAAEAEGTMDDGLWWILAALVLWPLEIAIRRRWMPWT